MGVDVLYHFQGSVSGDFGGGMGSSLRADSGYHNILWDGCQDGADHSRPRTTINQPMRLRKTRSIGHTLPNRQKLLMT